MAIDRAPRRITALEHINKVDPNLLNALQQPASSTAPSTEAEREASPAKWFIPVDYKKVTDEADGDLWDDTGESDYGSARVPMSRIAMRDANGLVPSSMLPSYVDDMMYGTYTYTSGSKTTFVEVVSGTQNTRTYVSPPSARTGHPEYLEPPENIIFVDKTTDLQYRFIKANENDNDKKYGFAEVPGSRAISPDHGIVTKNDGNAIEIAVKTPQLIVRSENSDTKTIDSNWCSWDVVQITQESQGDIGCNERSGTGPNKYIELSNLHCKDSTSATKQESWYKITLQLLAKPTTNAMLSDNIYDVSLVDPDNHISSTDQMDMSGPNGTWNVLNFEMVVLPNLSGIVRLYLTADVPSGTTITEKIQNFTVVELL